MVYVQVSRATRVAIYEEVQRYIKSIPGITVFPTASTAPTTKEFLVGDWTIKDVAGRGASSITVSASHRYTAEE